MEPESAEGLEQMLQGLGEGLTQLVDGLGKSGAPPEVMEPFSAALEAFTAGYQAIQGAGEQQAQGQSPQEAGGAQVAQAGNNQMRG